MICNPFFSVASCARGSFTFKTSLLTGALPLMTAPLVVCCCCIDAPPCAKASDDTSAISSIATITLLLLFMILIRITPLLSRCAGCRLGLRHGDYNGAIRVEQVLVRNTLHIFLGDRGDFVQSSINQVWIVVVGRVLPDRDRSKK